MGMYEEVQTSPEHETAADTYREPRVNSFLLSHSPIINAWRWLYDPGHPFDHPTLPAV